MAQLVKDVISFVYRRREWAFEAAADPQAAWPTFLLEICSYTFAKLDAWCVHKQAGKNPLLAKKKACLLAGCSLM